MQRSREAAHILAKFLAMKIAKPPFDFDRFRLIVAAALPCRHLKAAIRRKIDARGRTRLRKQCRECGSPLPGEVKHREAGQPLTRFRFWDAAAQTRFWRIYYPVAEAARCSINFERSDEWWRQYVQYLHSPEWAVRSRACIEAAHGVCVKCRRRTAIQAHHASYDRVGKENPDDLEAVCLECHKSFHGGSFR